MSFSKILFPVDFSARCTAVVPQVREACSGFSASLTLLHLVETPALSYTAAEAPLVFDYPIDEIIEAARHQRAPRA